jgi:hypothetical protein
MQFFAAVNDFANAVGFLSMAMIRHSHGDSIPSQQDLDSALDDAARAMSALYDAQQQHVVAAMMQTFENVSWWGSAHQEYERHEQEALCLYRSIGERMEQLNAADEEAASVISHLLSDEEEDEDAVLEFTAEKEHLARCLSI